MRHDELAIFFYMRGGQVLGELRETECDHYTYDVCIVTEVKIDILINWECDGVVVERDVDLGGGLGDDMVLHTSEDFLDVTCGLSIVLRLVSSLSTYQCRLHGLLAIRKLCRLRKQCRARTRSLPTLRM